MTGTNGLDPRQQLIEKAKCPDSPTKKQYPNSELAWDAARHRTEQSGLEIIAYACPGCGYFHLSRKVKGSDVVVKAPVGISTGALRNKMPVRQVLPGGRVELPPEGPIMPANSAAKRKALIAFLEGRDAVSTDEVGTALGMSRHTSAKYLTELGWKSGRGPGAVWRPKPRLTAVEDAGKSTVDEEIEAAIARHPASRGGEWWEIEAFPPNVSVHDYLLTLKTAGLEVRVQARRLP